MSKKIAILAAAVTVSVLLVAGVAGQGSAKSTTAAALKTQLQQKLDEWHNAGKFPGATLGVVLSDGSSFGLAVGYSDRDKKAAMRPSDRMLAGSTGKTFAAATAFQLISEG